MKNMSFDELYSDQLAATLQYLLAKRLTYNRTFDNVSLETNKKELIVRWFDPKVPAPDGKQTFQRHGVPFTMDGVLAEIKRQFEKLQADEKRGLLE